MGGHPSERLLFDLSSSPELGVCETKQASLLCSSHHLLHFSRLYVWYLEPRRRRACFVQLINIDIPNSSRELGFSTLEDSNNEGGNRMRIRLPVILIAISPRVSPIKLKIREFLTASAGPSIAPTLVRLSEWLASIQAGTLEKPSARRLANGDPTKRI